MIRTTVNPAPTTTGAIVCNGLDCIIQNGDINSDTIILGSGGGTTVRNCKLNGNVTNPTGIIVSFFSASCNIVNCEISNTLTGTGITINGFDTVVDGCTILGTADGIAVNGTRTIIQNCVLESNRNNGLFSTPSTRGLVVENCLAEFNFESGFRIDGPSVATNIDATINNCKAQFNRGTLNIVGSHGVVVGLANNLQAHYDRVGGYVIINDFGIRVTNNNGKGNPNGDMVMVLTITDPLNVQPTISGTQRVISPPVGVTTANNGALVNDTTAGSTNDFPPVSPGIGSNLALG